MQYVNIPTRVHSHASKCGIQSGNPAKECVGFEIHIRGIARYTNNTHTLDVLLDRAGRTVVVVDSHMREHRYLVPGSGLFAGDRMNMAPQSAVDDRGVLPRHMTDSHYGRTPVTQTL
jgi:hypothetical protein